MAIINFRVGTGGGGYEEGYEEGYEVGYDEGKVGAVKEAVEVAFDLGKSSGLEIGKEQGKEEGKDIQKQLMSEITIDSNGVYERADGYNKVTVTKRVDLAKSGLTLAYASADVTKDSFVLGNVTSLDYFFYEFKGTIEEDFMANVKLGNLNRAFSNFKPRDKKMPYVDTSDTTVLSYALFTAFVDEVHMDCSNATNLQSFINGSQIKRISVTSTAKCTNFAYAFNENYLEYVDEIDFSAIGDKQFTGSNTNTNYFFSNSTVATVTSISMRFKNIGWGTTSTNTSYNPWYTKTASLFDAETRQSFIDALVDYSGGTTHSIKLHATFLANLTPEQIAQATAKNWTLS